MQSIKFVVDALSLSDATGEGNSEATTTAASNAPATANARASASIAVPPAAPAALAAPAAGNAMHGAKRIPPLRPSPALLSPAAAATAAATASAAAVVGSRWEQPYALIGHSMSAGMAMMFAATFPEHMHKVGRRRRDVHAARTAWHGMATGGMRV